MKPLLRSILKTLGYATLFYARTHTAGDADGITASHKMVKSSLSILFFNLKMINFSILTEGSSESAVVFEKQIELLRLQIRKSKDQIADLQV